MAIKIPEQISTAQMLGLTPKQEEIANFLEDNYVKSLEHQAKYEAIRHLANLTYGDNWSDDVLAAYDFLASVSGDNWNYVGD